LIQAPVTGSLIGREGFELSYETIEISEAAPGVRYLTLNRPDKRNAINNLMRGELLDALATGDKDDAVRVHVLRGAGKCFSSGYDLKSDLAAEQPYFTADVGMQWARHVGEGWMSIWDLAKPVVAMIHGYAMAGGLELAGACDLAYASKTATLSHPVLQFAGLPDFAWFPAMMQPRHAMELHLTGRQYNGDEAASVGLINQAFAEDELEENVLQIALRIAQAPPAVVAVNKRFVHAAQDARGARSIIRMGADMQAGPHMQALMGGGIEGLSDDVKSANKKSE
jgi:enoyl-CoA hydratase